MSPGSTLSSFGLKASLRKAPVPPTRTSSFKEAVWDAPVAISAKQPNWSNLSESFSDHVQSQSSSDDLLSTSASRSGSFDQILATTTTSAPHNKQPFVPPTTATQAEAPPSGLKGAVESSEAHFPPPPDFLLETTASKVVNGSATKRGGSKNSLEDLCDSGHSSPAPGFFNAEAGRNCATLPRKSAAVSEELAEVLNRRRRSELNKVVALQGMSQSFMAKKMEGKTEKIPEEGSENTAKSPLRRSAKGAVTLTPTPELRKKVEDWQAGVEMCFRDQRPSKEGPFSVTLNKVPDTTSPGSDGKQASPSDPDEKAKSLLSHLKKVEPGRLEHKNPPKNVRASSQEALCNDDPSHKSSLKPLNHRPSPRLGIAALKEKRTSAYEKSNESTCKSNESNFKSSDTEGHSASNKESLKEFEKCLQQRLNNLKSPVKEDTPTLDKPDKGEEGTTNFKGVLPTIRSRKFTKNVSNDPEVRKSQPPSHCRKSFSPSSRKNYLKTDTEPSVINELKSLDHKFPQLKPLSEVKEINATSSNVLPAKEAMVKKESPMEEPVMSKEALINSLLSFQNKINRLRKKNSFIANKLSNNAAKPAVAISDDFQVLLKRCSSYVDSLPPQLKFQFRGVLCSLEKSGEIFFKSSFNAPNDKQCDLCSDFCEALKCAEETFKK